MAGIRAFINRLKAYQREGVVNPWQDYDERYDIHKRAAFIRRQQLEAYLTARLGRAKYIMVAEAVGYQGGRFTGIAMTCERMLLGYHKEVRPDMILTGITPKRTSHPESAFIEKTIQREKGFNEPTDTIVWGAMLEAGVDPFDVILWNIFPFHPIHGQDGLTNRTPTSIELEEGWLYTKRLLTYFPQADVLAIGQKASDTLQAYGVDVKATLRHPANGGAKLYKEQFAAYCHQVSYPLSDV